MSLSTIKQVADAALGLLFAAMILILVAVLVFTGRFGEWSAYVGILFFAGMAAMCFRDLVKRRRAADRRGFDVIAPEKREDAG